MLYDVLSPIQNKSLSDLCQVFLAQLSQRLIGELIVYLCSLRPSSYVGHSGPITMKFYQKHNWDGEGFIRFWARPDQNSGFHGNRYLP